jgi:type IV pilus assembly protein PilO
VDLNDLNNIDLNNLSAAPLPVKIVGIVLVCVLIVAGGYWFIIKGELEEYAEVQAQEEGLRTTYLNKKALAINLPIYRVQLEEMRKTFGTMLRQLPNTSEVPDLLIDITQAGLGRGLEFVLFKPERERPIDFYAELPINLRVTGSYHELSEFISDVSALPRIVTVSDITINSAGGDKAKLNMTAIARTYRYVEAQ